jgi:DNA invertase Pin-like site-specific DNA recombinase
MPPAILYARFSPRPGAEECDSCDKQLARTRAYCAGLGYDVAGEYRDDNESGGRADNRPELQKAVEHARRAKAVLVVYKLDRLARNTQDALAITSRLTDAGADLASITETVNTRSPMGRFFLTVLAAFAELEREQIRERTSKAMRAHQAGGRRMTRLDRCPFGFRPDPDSAAVERKGRDGLPSGKPAGLAEHPGEQRAISRMRELRALGLGLRAICRRLAEEGHRPRGRRWHEATVATILRRPVG